MNFLTNALENTHINDALDVVLVLYDSDIVKAIDLSQQEILAFDCEGVDFGRPGKVCIVQLSTRTTCYLFDVLGLEKNSPILLFLKSILESTAILKIIHDCKTDSDALYHLSDIKICNCHDTQVWDRILFNRQKGFGLNQTLALNDCPVNDARDPQMYQRNNAFWAKRPLTKRMIAWASGDVSSLFELYDKQITIATEEQRLECQIETERSEAFLRDCLIKRVTVKSTAKLIGSGVLNYISEIVPGTHCQPRGTDTLWIYGTSEEEITRVHQRLEPFC